MDVPKIITMLESVAHEMYHLFTQHLLKSENDYYYRSTRSPDSEARALVAIAEYIYDLRRLAVDAGEIKKRMKEYRRNKLYKTNTVWVERLLKSLEFAKVVLKRLERYTMRFDFPADLLLNSSQDLQAHHCHLNLEILTKKIFLWRNEIRPVVKKLKLTEEFQVVEAYNVLRIPYIESFQLDVCT